MKRIAWLSDIHLDHLEKETNNPGSSWLEDICGYESGIFKWNELRESMLLHQPEGVVITGDISTSSKLCGHLNKLPRLFGCPVWFVLGNHDYYGSSVSTVRRGMKTHYGLTSDASKAKWLPALSGVVKITDNTCLTGHDGWYDGGYGDWFNSKLNMSDYYFIEELKGPSKTARFEAMNKLAQDSVDHVYATLPLACQQYKNVVYATHVPPFRNNSRSPGGKLSNENWLPCYSNKKLGDALLGVANKYPKTSIVCLSGHTHTYWEERYSDNLTCVTACSEYGQPTMSLKVLEVE